MASEIDQKSKFEVIIKWVAITFISCTLILVIGTFFFAWKFTPLVKINDSGIEILNGVISIKD